MKFLLVILTLFCLIFLLLGFFFENLTVQVLQLGTGTQMWKTTISLDFSLGVLVTINYTTVNTFVCMHSFLARFHFTHVQLYDLLYYKHLLCSVYIRPTFLFIV